MCHLAVFCIREMIRIMRRLFIFPLVLCYFGVNAAEYDFILQDLKELSQRVGHLEAREKFHLQKINDLESRDHLRQATIYRLKQEIKEQRRLIETMEATQTATIIDLETQRKQIKSMDVKSPQVDDNSSQLHTEKHVQFQAAVNKRSVNKIRQAEFENPIAFYATIGNHHLEHAGAGQVIVYDHVITNSGHAYNGNTGVFTAPIEGIYVFSTTIVALDHVNGHAAFYKNSVKINNMIVSGIEAAYDTSSSTIVLQMQKGDVVTVRSVDHDRSFTGKGHSGFSGFLLSSYINNPVIVG